MTPRFEFDDGDYLITKEPVQVNLAEGPNDSNHSTDIFLSSGTQQRSVEILTEDADKITGVRLEKGEPKGNLMVNRKPSKSVKIPRKFSVVVHSV